MPRHLGANVLPQLPQHLAELGVVDAPRPIDIRLKKEQLEHVLGQVKGCPQARTPGSRSGSVSSAFLQTDAFLEPGLEAVMSLLLLLSVVTSPAGGAEQWGAKALPYADWFGFGLAYISYGLSLSSGFRLYFVRARARAHMHMHTHTQTQTHFTVPFVHEHS